MIPLSRYAPSPKGDNVIAAGRPLLAVSYDVRCSRPRPASTVQRRWNIMAFEFPLRVYWEDTDASGVVFYANFLKFFERGRTEWLRSLGIAQQSLREQTGGIFVVTSAQLQYLRPARLDDQLIVTAKLQSAGRASLTIEQQALLVNPDNQAGEPLQLCTGSIRIGWVDGTTMRPARIPNRILEQLS